MTTTKPIILVYLKSIETTSKSRWKYGVPSVFNRGTISWTLNSWSSKSAAIRRARQEYPGFTKEFRIVK